jgi:hypothetical protein
VPVNIKIIHASNFIRATVDGALDRRTSIQTLVDLAWTIKTPGENHVLIDTRDARVKLSPDDLFELGVAITRFPSLAKSKTALLTAMDGAHPARYLEVVAQNRGALFRAFTSFQEAITWLSTKEQQARLTTASQERNDHAAQQVDAADKNLNQGARRAKWNDQYRHHDCNCYDERISNSRWRPR